MSVKEEFNKTYLGPAFTVREVKAIMPIGVCIPALTDVKIVSSGKDRSSVEVKDVDSNIVRTVIIPNDALAIDFHDLTGLPRSEEGL